MKIGIIAGTSFYKTSAYYIARILIREAARSRPDTRFFIFDTAVAAVLPLPENTTKVPVPQLLKGLLKPGILQQKKLAAKIKKFEINKLWVFDPADIITTSLHQTLILNIEHKTDAHTLQRITKCDQIRCFSASHLQKLLALLPCAADRISGAEPLVSEGFAPLCYNERLEVKEKFADGKEYFFWAGLECDPEVFLLLLKAFSAFKKMQQSNWKLVVFLRPALSVKEKEELLQPLQSFKFRKDVVIGNSRSDTDLQECLAGAYAALSLPGASIFPFPLIEALRCGVPVITIKTADTDALSPALRIVNENSAEELAAQMMALYKNEKLRTRLSKNADEMMQHADAPHRAQMLAAQLL